MRRCSRCDCWVTEPLPAGHRASTARVVVLRSTRTPTSRATRDPRATSVGRPSYLRIEDRGGGLFAAAATRGARAAAAAARRPPPRAAQAGGGGRDRGLWARRSASDATFLRADMAEASERILRAGEKAAATASPHDAARLTRGAGRTPTRSSSATRPPAWSCRRLGLRLRRSVQPCRSTAA